MKLKNVVNEADCTMLLSRYLLCTKRKYIQFMDGELGGSAGSSASRCVGTTGASVWIRLSCSSDSSRRHSAWKIPVQSSLVKLFLIMSMYNSIAESYFEEEKSAAFEM